MDSAELAQLKQDIAHAESRIDGLNSKRDTIGKQIKREQSALDLLKQQLPQTAEAQPAASVAPAASAPAAPTVAAPASAKADAAPDASN